MSLGEQIRSARLAKNLSIEQLSKLSRVSVKNITSFENDNFSIDAIVFVKANLQAIAKALDIELVETSPLHEPTVPPQIMNVLDREGVPLEKRNYTPIIMGIGLVTLFAVIIYGLFTRSPQVLEPLPTISITSTPTENPTPNIGSGVRVTLVAESRSWVSVKNSTNQIIFERIAEAGERLDFSDTLSLTVTVGNAAGVNITVNDENIGYLGGIGEVVSQIFTSPSGI
ncbi:MAG: helix-turn-helix domain-containing protein [Candidatus Nanopelagicales bacterium]